MRESECGTLFGSCRVFEFSYSPDFRARAVVVVCFLGSGAAYLIISVQPTH